MSSITIQSINLLDNKIIVTFNKNWFQEDIATLRKLLLSNISELSIKEVIVGADIENVRFMLLDKEFTLNFEYYSQSCWFDTQSLDSLPEINVLYNTLTNNNNEAL